MTVADLTLFGTFALRLADGRAVDLPGQKNRALLAILALNAGTPQPRERLASLLWSDRGDYQARDGLKHALTRIRQCLGDVSHSALVADRLTAHLDSAALSTDVLRFERLLRAGTPEALEQACDLCSGNLLDGINIRDHAFDDWLLAERQRLRRLHEDALTKLLAPSLPIAVRERAARRLLSLDPLRETANRALMQICVERGERAQGIRLFETLRDQLHSELGVKPEPETLRLVEAIRKHRVDTPAIEIDGAKPPAPLEPVQLGNSSIAVLPLRNLGSDPEHEFFADGLTEDLITDLARAGLPVIARNSSFAYKGQSIDPRTVAQSLGVRYILEGSARRASQRVRINVQLIDAMTGSHLWAERYDRSLDDMFLVQDEVASKIVESLSGRLIQRVPRHRPKNMEAWKCCVMARRLNEQSAMAMREARVLLERALEIDPDYAEAHRWFATNLWSGWAYWGEPMEPSRSLSMDHADRAVALDPSDSGCHWVRATILQYERRYEEAEQEFARALELDPNDADCWAVKSDFSVLDGEPKRGLEEIEKALRLDPISLNWYYVLKGQAQYALGHYEEAVQTLRQETTWRIHAKRYLAASLAQLGRMDEARHEAKVFLAMHPEFRISYWTATQPFRDMALLERIVDGYRKAGLPE